MSTAAAPTPARWSRESAITLADGSAAARCPWVEALLAEYAAAVRRVSLEGVGGIELVCDVFPASAPERAALVLVHGTGEASIRYLELMHDLRRLFPAWSLYLPNHRGQGLSQRLLERRPWRAIADDPAAQARYQTCHVERFDDYVSDLERCLAEVVQPATHPCLLGLGHSGGATILLRHAQRHPGRFVALAGTAPMVEIRGLWGLPVGRDVLGRTALAAALVAGRGEDYAIGQGPYRPLPFREADGRLNPVTGSEARYRLRSHLQARFPETALGGPSWRWVAEAIAAGAALRREAARIATPLLVVDAGCDALVNAAASTAFAAAVARAHPGGCRHLHLAASRHELLIERDALRDRVLDAITDFLAAACPPGDGG